MGSRQGDLRLVHGDRDAAFGPARPAEVDAGVGADARGLPAVQVDVRVPDRVPRRRPFDPFAPARACGSSDVGRDRLCAVQVRVARRHQALFGGWRMNTLRVGWLYFKVGVLNELQYRVNFFVQVLQSLIQVGTGLVMLSLVYSHTTELNGWSESELLTLIGVQILLGGLIHAFIQPNMERLLEDVQQGTLDYALTKPQDSQVLLSVRQVRMWQVVEMISGLILVIVGLTRLEQSIGPVDVLAFAFSL